MRGEIIALTVEHPCSRCGAAVEDNSPFCPHCDAPQIRFSAREEETPGRATVPDAVIAPPPPQPEQSTYQPGPRNWPVQQDYRSFHRQLAPHRKEFVRSAVYAGIIGAILSALPFVFLFAVPLSGVLSVVFYRKRTAALDVTPSMGLRLGSLAGLCAFGCFLVLLGIETLGLHHTSEFRQAMVDRIHQAQAMNPDPQAQQVFRYFLTPQGMEIMMILGLVFMCIIFVLLAGLGGTAAAFSRRSPPRG